MGRAPCCEKVGLKKGRWTAEEDEILMNYIKANGEGSWRSLPKNAGLLRCGKSCRLRWINYLKTDLKRGNISAEEEETIIKLRASIGNRWSVIAGHLPGRTDNEIKNYWNSHLSRRIHSFRRNNGEGVTVIMDLGKIVGGGRCKRRGGRTSRSAMKKNTCTIGAARRERHDHKGGGDLLGQSEITRGGGVLKEPHKASGVVPVDGHTGEAQSSVLSGEGGLGSELFCPDDDQVLQSGLWDPNEEIESGFFSVSEEMESGFFGSSVESGGWASNEERESGSLNEEERETPATTVGGVTNHTGSTVVEGEGWDDAYGSLQLQTETSTPVDWDLEGMAAKLWDDAGETWSWLWDGELEFQQQQPVVGCGGGFDLPEWALDSWLLSDVL